MFQHVRHSGDNGPHLKQLRHIGYLGKSQDRQAYIKNCPQDFEVQVAIDGAITFCMAVAPDKGQGFLERWAKYNLPRRTALTREQCEMPLERVIEALRATVTDGDKLQDGPVAAN